MVGHTLMSGSYFFGYGSLVNLHTHGYDEAHDATLHGWRRVWYHTSLRPIAFLSVERHAESHIHGLIAQVPKNDWAVLDEREFAYDRVGISTQVAHPLSDTLDVAVYQVSSDHKTEEDIQHPILLSYIDVVAQGFLHRLGEDAVADFFTTTQGWDAPILNDRAAPIYPRHQTLTGSETAMVDHHLKTLGTKIID
ncbi:gamma-glutamylcyclotransferase family protein [Shimia sp. R11_0]|uniref:gamma-glutamylcyclotransferase family protein n=1 Tax=Shimia sp. R11_0 TaxID=2821096 RepID=UPI001FFE2146|nr:gamma-glutamylcyclotransferase family protein [Shimia sp. R11_0]